MRSSLVLLSLSLFLFGCGSSENTEPHAYSGGDYNPPASRNITINGSAPNFSNLAQLEQMIGIQLPDGSYWYDDISGAVGMWGGPCAGALPAYLDIAGPMPSNASNGNTGVFINGRQLHQIDVRLLNMVLIPNGSYCQPGRWTFDAQGNFGPEGGMMMGNIYVLAAQAQQAGGGGGGSGGDNFWTSRTGFGNSSGGSGYIKLPNGSYHSW